MLSFVHYNVEDATAYLSSKVSTLESGLSAGLDLDSFIELVWSPGRVRIKLSKLSVETWTAVSSSVWPSNVLKKQLSLFRIQ